MPKFTKKPVTIEARQLQDGMETAAYLDLLRWCGGKEFHDNNGAQIVIETLEGDHLASPGDWIIQGVKGEFYPCKPDIFEATYDAADAA